MTDPKLSGGNGFTADPAALARHAAEFPGYAQRAGQIHAQLADALSAAGSCWGDDEVGRSFAQSHVRDASATVDRLGGLPSRLGDVGNRLSTTARGYQQADQYGAGLLPPTD